MQAWSINAPAMRGEKKCHALKHLSSAWRLRLRAGAVAAAQAEDGIYVPLFTYRTGPFAASGIPIANGMHDYLNMLNARDGGIGGAKLIVEECETGYDTKKGVECYEAVKGKHPVVINPYSTGITLQLIPKAAVDKIPILSMAYGLSASADGNDFPVDLQSAGDLLGRRLDVRQLYRRQGRRLRQAQGQDHRLHLSSTAVMAASRSRCCRHLAKDYGFELKLYPVPAAEMQNQGSLWLSVRRDRPDWMYHVGLGRHEPDRGQGSRQDRLPDGSLHRHLVVGQRRRCASGRARRPRAILSLNFNAVGADFPAIQDIVKYVVDKGNSQIAEGQGRRELL